MPRYFFDVNDGHREVRDERGIDLPGVDAVPSEAYNLLRMMVQDKMPVGHVTLTVSVRDNDGRLVHRGEMSIKGTRFDR